MTTVETVPDLVAEDVFDKWLSRFADDVGSADAARIAAHVRDDGYLRDILAFGWDFRTLAGPAEIGALLAGTSSTVQPRELRRAHQRMSPRIVRRSGRTVLEAYFDFETSVGRASSFVRLQLTEDEEPKIWTMLTALQELRGFEERIGDRRPSGTEYSYNFSGNNWLDDRIARARFTDRQPEVIVIGGGQAGLTIGARLGAIGVDALVVESEARVGDNWRKRYHALALHNEVWSNGLPYMPFPPNWPTFLPKDKLADWLEAYAIFMELNVWTSTRMTGARYDEDARLWSVTLQHDDGATTTMTAPHLVMATGSVAGAPIVPRLPGLDGFAGEVVHSASFTSGVPYAGKRAIVVGTGNSGHDVAQDLHSNGAAEVTIVQRSPTCVVSLVPVGTMVYSLYTEGPTDDIDLITASIPYPVLRNSYQWLTKKTCEIDKELLDKLRDVGFEITMGEDETGFHMMYLRSGGGYYINVGCSDLIADGKVKLAHARDMDTFVPEGLRLADGTVIPADLVVLATGFETQSTVIRRLLGDEVADRVGELWGFDDQGFMRGMWKRTGQEHLWIMGGALNDCRLYSRFLALQIKADLEGLLPERAQV